MFINKQQLQKEIRSGNLIIFNFTSIGNLWASKEAKLIIHIFFSVESLCSVESSDSDPMQYRHMKDANGK